MSSANDGDSGSTAPSLTYFGEFVGGPYDGMSLEVRGVSPPCSVSLDQGVLHFDGKNRFVPLQYAKGRYCLIATVVTICEDLHELEDFMQDDEAWKVMLLEAEKASNGDVSVRCRYEWDIEGDRDE